MPPGIVCSGCLKRMAMKGGRLSMTATGGSVPVVIPRTVLQNSRQMSWWSNFLKQGDETSARRLTSDNPRLQNSSPSSVKNPEETLVDSLTKVLYKHQDPISQHKLEQELVAWGESDPVIETTILPFVDPLGHLTYAQQKAYFASPPNEYLETLEERARAREVFEKNLFLADPLTFWRFCYSSRPDFGRDRLPPWQRWSYERRLQVMEKYRRYDERLQRKINRIYEYFDSDEYRLRVRQKLKYRMGKEAKRKPIVGKQGKVIELQLEDPPLHVVERRVLRIAVEARNVSLNSLWYSHMNKVSAFKDLTEDGSTVDEDRKKRGLSVMERKKAEEYRHQRLMKEWTTLPPEAKTDSVDWNAIYSEEKMSVANRL